MIKFPHSADGNSKRQKFILATDQVVTALDAAELIPIDCGGRLVTNTTSSTTTPPVTVNDLGKQLLKAAATGNIEDTKQLLNRGALFTADWLGTSPLHLAARNNHLEICEILLKAGISRDARTKVDKTSLHVAAYEGHNRIVETLLQYGSEPDCRDLLGMTPLHWAAQRGHADVVKTLMRHCVQTDLINKYELSAADIAEQIGRKDIVQIINNEHGLEEQETNEEMGAMQHLTLELIENSNESSSLNHNLDGAASEGAIPLETILLEDTEQHEEEEEIEEVKRTEIKEDNSNNFAESIKFLQQHGITMLPQDDSSNILTTVMQTGHSVVLTDVGKQVLDSLKESEKSTTTNHLPTNKKIITVTPEEFLSMTSATKGKNILKQLNGRLTPKNHAKRIVMKKNKVIPVSSINNIYKMSSSATSSNGTDMETVMTQLIEARKTIEEYKRKLFKKEREAERYKQQLKLLMDDS